ncbi:MAG: hypothetical protein WD036_09110 [Bauldia sp.]
MITRGEIVRSLQAAWELFLDRPQAVRQFDASYGGFWRSFQAIVLIAPAYALTILDAMAEDGLDEPAFMAAKWLTLALDWIALPLLLAGLAGFLDIKRGYMAYIVARNWSSVLAVLPFAAISLLSLIGLIDARLLFLPSIIALAVALRFSYQIARRALGVAVHAAIGFVALDFLVSLGVAMLVGRLFGVAVPI